MRGLGKLKTYQQTIMEFKMKKKQKSLYRYILALFALAIFALFVRCSDETTVEPIDTEPTTDQGALEKLDVA